MELYEFLRGTLAWTVSVAALWPLNIPLAVLAYRIHRGQRKFAVGEKPGPDTFFAPRNRFEDTQLSGAKKAVCPRFFGAGRAF